MSTHLCIGCYAEMLNSPSDTNRTPTVRAKVDDGVHRFCFWLVDEFQAEAEGQALRKVRR